MPTQSSINPEAIEQELTDFLYSFNSDPLGFVNSAYDWGRGELEGFTGPRQWQRDILNCVGEHLKGPDSWKKPLKIAVASGNGIGKSCLVGWLVGWAMSTAVDTRIKITAAKGEQLATKTVPEVSAWFRHLINAHWWDVRAQSIKIKDPKHAVSWRADFETWSEENTAGFQGLHNVKKRLILIMDEASGIPDTIWNVSETALTDDDTQVMWFAFGNPTETVGRFRECFGKYKDSWKRFQIDSRTVDGTNKAQLDEWVNEYGEDSDWVRVHVRGEFPRASDRQFIPSDYVAVARKYRADGFAGLPTILGVDIARFGADQSVVVKRQGRKSEILGRYRGLDTIQMAERVIEFIQREQPDATVVDGDNFGAGTVDHIKERGYGTRLFEFHGGAKPSDAKAYYNKRAEVWGLMKDWLRKGAEIPDEPELAEDLTSPEYSTRGDDGRIQLERKEDMKSRGLSSPDLADALAMTFSVNVVRKPKPVAPNYAQYGDSSWMQ